MSIYLNQKEIEGITHKTRHKAQVEALLAMGIPCKVRPDGTPLVSRMAYEQSMGVKTLIDQDEPDFESLAHAS